MGIADLYIESQRSFVEFCAGLGEGDWSTPVPCTPEWTVWDVASHVAGVADDIVHGRVEGAATDPWTAVQIDRWRETPRSELIARWNEQVEQAGAIVEAVGEPRPPLDCHNHEHDVRHALARPGNRESALVRWAVEMFGGASVGRPVHIEFSDGGTGQIDGTGVPIRLRGMTRFDLMRSRLGRRSRGQVVAWDWSEPPPDDLVEGWFVFGPSRRDIDE